VPAHGLILGANAVGALVTFKIPLLGSMDEQDSLVAAIYEEVRLQPYDPAWPLAFAAERDRLLSLLPDTFIAIEHFGSTAVPGLPAKPVIDLLAGVRTMTEAEATTRPLAQAAYTTSAEFNESLTNRKWFMRWSNGHRTHHLHVVVHGGPVWTERLAFRDALRSNPSLAMRYAELKQALAAQLGGDREAYTDAKTEFVRSSLRDNSLNRLPATQVVDTGAPVHAGNLASACGDGG